MTRADRLRLLTARAGMRWSRRFSARILARNAATRNERHRLEVQAEQLFRRLLAAQR